MPTRSKKTRQQCALPPDPPWTLAAPSSHWQWLSPSLSALRRHDPKGRLPICNLLQPSVHRVCSRSPIDSSSSNQTAIRRCPKRVLSSTHKVTNVKWPSIGLKSRCYRNQVSSLLTTLRTKPHSNSPPIRLKLSGSGLPKLGGANS